MISRVINMAASENSNIVNANTANIVMEIVKLQKEEDFLKYKQ